MPLRSERVFAADLLKVYARDPTAAAKMMGFQTMSNLQPAALLLAQKVVTDFAGTIVADASQIRAIVINKLILESDSPDPKVRLKACELLGKIEDVGLFKEKSDGSVSSYSLQELQERLKAKLGQLVGTAVEDAVVVEDGAFDVDEVLGLEPAAYDATPASALPDVPDDLEAELERTYASLKRETDAD